MTILSYRIRKGFTLAELLIALTILGVIATFTIPKILNASQNQKYKTIFIETYSALSQVLDEGLKTNINYNDIEFLKDLSKKFNGVKICPTNSVNEGCWTNTQVKSLIEGQNPGIILHTGATLTGFSQLNEYADAVVLDVNGPAPPNNYGEDTIELVICYKPYTWCQHWRDGGWVDDSYTGKIGYGTIAPVWPATLFSEWLK